MIKNRILETVLSKHGTKNLQSSELICYFSSTEQQRERAEHASKNKNEE